MLLFGLPRDVYNAICSEWLSFKQLGLIDTAMSSKALKLLWREQLVSKTIIVSLEEHQYSVTSLNWLYCRNMNLTKLILCGDHFDKTGYLCNVDFSKVKSLTVSRLKKTYNVDLVMNSCINLTSFENDASIPDYTCRLPSSVMNNLTSISLISSWESEEQFNALSYIREHCTKLRHITLPKIGVAETSDGLYEDEVKQSEILSGNLELESIVAESSVLLFDTMVKHNHKLKEIQFRLSFLSMELILKVLQCSHFVNVLITCQAGSSSYVEVLHLSSMKSVTRLMLNGVRFSKSTDKRLADEVKELTELDLGSQTVADYVLQRVCQHSFESLQVMTITKYVDMSENNLQIVLKFPNLTSLSIGKAPWESELLISALVQAQCLNLRTFKIRLSALKLDVIVAVLNRFEQLHEATFEGRLENNFDNELLHFLRQLTISDRKLCVSVGHERDIPLVNDTKDDVKMIESVTVSPSLQYNTYSYYE